MRQTSFQRGWVRGFQRGLNNTQTPEQRQQLAADLGAISGLYLPGDERLAWDGEELRQEREHIEELIEAEDYRTERGREREDVERLAWQRVPEHLREGLARYLDEHVQPGQFLVAVLSNDLREAFARADTSSRAGLFDLVKYLYNHAPGGAWGGKRQVEYWLTPIVPELHLAVPPVIELEIDNEGRTACPQCGGRHVVHHGRAEAGRIFLPEDGATKTAHDVQFVYCRRIHLVLVGVEGKELP